GMSGLAGQLGSGVNPLTASSIEVRERVNLLSTIEGLPVLPPVANTSTLSQNVVGGLGQSLTDLVLNRYNNYRVGVQVSLPIKNRVAEGQLGRSLVEGQRIETQRQQLEQSIQIEVRNALQSVRTAQSRLRSAAA